MAKNEPRKPPSKARFEPNFYRRSTEAGWAQTDQETILLFGFAAEETDSMFIGERALPRSKKLVVTASCLWGQTGGLLRVRLQKM